jgi:hypothetical protein
MEEDSQRERQTRNMVRGKERVESNGIQTAKR